MKYDWNHLDPRTGLPREIRNTEPRIQLMSGTPHRSCWIYMLNNRVGLYTVGNIRYKKLVWFDIYDMTVSSTQDKEDAQHFRTATFPGLGRPAGWIEATPEVRRKLGEC